MRLDGAYSLGVLLGLFVTTTHAFTTTTTSRVHRRLSFLPMAPAQWDGDDFAQPLGGGGEAESAPTSRFADLLAAQQAAGDAPRVPMGAPPSFADLSEEVLNQPPPPNPYAAAYPPPGYPDPNINPYPPNPYAAAAAYPPPPPGYPDPNNPYPGYPPPPPAAVDPNNPYPPPPNPYAGYPPGYGYPPQYPPQTYPPYPGYPPQDPNNPYAAYPPQDPNNPYPDYPPPVDPNNPYAASAYPPPPVQQQAPPPPAVEQVQAPPPPVQQAPPPPVEQVQAPPPPVQQAPPPPPPPPVVQATPPPPPPPPVVVQETPPPPPKKEAPPVTQDASGKKIGRNKDADRVRNTSDSYFAKLKLDTKIRKKAFFDGDMETFNAALSDERVEQLGADLAADKDLAVERQKNVKQQQSMIDQHTSDDEQVLDPEDVGETPPPVVTAVSPPPPPPAATAPPPPFQAAGVTPYTPAADPAPPVTPATPPEQVPTEEQQPEITTFTVELPAAPVVAVPQSTDFDSEEYLEDSKRQLRTIMGYMLKHRGGVGFGGGRLKLQHDKDGFVASLKEITKMLRLEAGGSVTEEENEEAGIVNDDQQQEDGETFTVELPAAPVAAVPQSTDFDSEEYIADSKKQLRTIMGYMLKHRGGVGFGGGRLKLQHDKDGFVASLDEVVKMLRSEAGDVVSVAAPVMAEEEVAAPPPAVVTPPPTPVAAAPVTIDDNGLSASIQCIEGAIAMYKNSGSSSDMLHPLRSALMASVNKLNQIIAEEEVISGVAAAATPIPDTDTVTLPPVETVFADSAAPLSNEERLRNTYAALEAATGDGKYGLKDLSPEEAENLANQLSEMKGVLLEELELDKPVAVPEVEEEEPEPVPSGATPTSRYKQMLAKAKAEEATRKGAN